MTIEVATLDDFNLISKRLDRIDQRLNESTKISASITLYTNSDLAKLLKVSCRCLQNWRDDGLIGFIQVRSKIYYTAEDLQRFINNNKNKPFKNYE